MIGRIFSWPDVVRPAAAVAALAAGDRREHQDRAVDLVAVEPVVGAGAEQDHAAPLGVDRVLCPLAGEPLHLGGGDAGVRLLPGGCRRDRRVVVAGRPLPGQPVALHAVLREQQVEHGGDEPVADPRDRHAAAGGGRPCRRRRRSAAARPRPPRRTPSCRVSSGVDVAELEVPPTQALVAEPVADGPLGTRTSPVPRVDDGRLPHGVLGVRPRAALDVAGDEVLARPVGRRRRRARGRRGWRGRCTACCSR